MMTDSHGQQIDRMNRPRLQNALKALLLLGLAVFLYTRLASGALFFYINQRFLAYTLLAIVGLVLIGVSYRPFGRLRPTEAADGGEMEHDTHGRSHAHGHDADHDHDHGSPGEHSHRLTWTGALLVLLPMVLGLIVSPRPLGAAALQNREVDVSASTSSLPAAVRAATAKATNERNVLDWLQTFSGSADAAHAFTGQTVSVVGFVFRDKRFADDQFMVTRFVVSCCVADANVAGLVVQSPTAAEYATDQWVQVDGMLEPGALEDKALPVIAARSITPVDIPDHPYLYP